MDTYAKAYYLRQFSLMPPATQRQILDQVHREQAAADARNQAIAARAGQIARLVVDGIMRDYGLKPPAPPAPQPKPRPRYCNSAGGRIRF